MSRRTKADWNIVREQILDLKLSVPEIAAEHGITREMVYHIAKRYGIKVEFRSKLMHLQQEQDRLQEQINQIIIEFKGGHDGNQMAERHR